MKLSTGGGKVDLRAPLNLWPRVPLAGMPKRVGERDEIEKNLDMNIIDWDFRGLPVAGELISSIGVTGCSLGVPTPSSGLDPGNT